MVGYPANNREKEVQFLRLQMGATFDSFQCDPEKPLKLSQSDIAEVGREYQERAIKFAWSADSLTP